MKEMDIKDELRSMFNLIRNGDVTYKLLFSEDNYDSFYIVDGEYRGVGIVIDEKFKDFKYRFENIMIKVDQRCTKDGNLQYYIQLLSKKIYDTNEFFFVCMKFIEPGEEGENRKLLLSNPQEWVDRWKLLFGNKSKDDSVYPMIGELLSLKHLLLNGEKASLTSQGSHDIETDLKNFEVKTTIMRYNSLIEIHSKNQLASLNGNPLYLYFVRLEESIVGVSLKSLINDLEKLNYDVNSLKEKFSDLNSESLDKCYKVDEIRLYNVDDSFPKIIDDSFKDDHLPNGIYSLTYVVDLSSLNYITIDFDKMA